MKLHFEEAELMLERFVVTDQTMTVSWIPGLGEDETNPIGTGSAISGN